MQKLDAKALLQKYNRGECSPAEIDIVESWYMGAEFGDSGSLSETEISVSLDRIRARLNSGVEEAKTQTKTRRLWQRVAVAASIVMVASVNLYLYTQKTVNDASTSIYANDIAPGKNGATLTLASGQQILINEAGAGTIANQSGVRISKMADGQIVYEITEDHKGGLGYNTLSTTRGEQAKVRLPDGTLVFLNAASSLKYPASFSGLDQRRVELSGEGYFEVAKDSEHPFIVGTQGQEVEVLGTHFNINSYQDEPVVATTLLEGSVRVSSGKVVKLLRPNQQSVLSADKLDIKNVDAEDMVAWKDGTFLFEEEKLESIMRRISRWYNVEVEYAEGVDRNELFGGGVSRYDKVSVVLEMLESTKHIHFKIEGRRITVMK